MSVHLALYRERRPRTFNEIVAQEHVTRTLLNAIGQGRLAHAYLFCGPRGTGKTSTARVLAKALNCPNAKGNEPCGICDTCRAIARGDGVDVIEMDAASNRGIEEIRNLRERVRLAPVSGRYKVYVIDEVHMLTNEAFNALLKTLEEPPANVLFILCTTEAYRVPATILSRCQRFDFHRLPTATIASHLGEVARDKGWTVDPPALAAIARAATGSMRDALGILDQCVAYSVCGVTLDDVRRVLGAVDPALLGELGRSLLARDVGGAWQALDDLLMQGRDAREAARALAGHLRDVLLYRLAGARGEPTGPLADDAATLAEHAALATDRQLYEAIDALATVEADMRLAPQPRLLLEARLVKLCGARGAPTEGTDGGRAVAPASRASAARAPSAGAPAPGHRAAAPAPGTLNDAQPAPRMADPLPATPREAVVANGPPASLAWASPVSDERDLGIGCFDDGCAPPPDEADVPVPEAPLPAAGRPPAAAPRRAEPAAAPKPTTTADEATVREPGRPGTGALDAAHVKKAFVAALAQLSDKDRGWLDGALAGWDGRTLTVWLPHDRAELAAFLDGREIRRELSRGLGRVLGHEPEVRIRARPQGPGLFADEETAPAPPAGRVAPDPIRRAQEMFGAEEVGKE
jgi:DNA polymerase-3 subunit gamma/tau